MDARVNDFLNEINEIAPLSENKEENVWEKCLDDDSGYYYYWNTKTNEVTWDMPSDYKSSKSKTKKINNLYIPPRTAPLFPSTSNIPPVSDAIKIYKIAESTNASISNNTSITSANNKINTIVKTETIPNSKEVRKKFKTKPPYKNDNSDDEKIILISSYGDESEDSEEEKGSKATKKVNGSKHSQYSDDDDDDVDILTKIHKKVKELKQVTNEPPKCAEKQLETKTISGFSLVAGYSDSEEELESIEQNKQVFLAPPPPINENKISHSTLFPVHKPIDVKDFEEPQPKTPQEEVGDSEYISKAFQRKRRIGVALVNTGKKNKIEDENSERKGLGFSSENSNTSNNEEPKSGSLYPGFKSGGLMLVKTDVLSPTEVQTNEKKNVDEKPKEIEEVFKDIEETYTTLKEKLGFLSEGREVVSPVQIMLIQIETLFTALKAGDLKQSYLRKWLDETCSDLIKLEKETTPEGWLLQWDRSHKRYYYQNEASGTTQWEYPDVTGCDEAMDICTTPPPNGAEAAIHISPPLPPMISNPSPPPPPIISDIKVSKKKKIDSKTESTDVPTTEPLPPGVDAAENQPKEATAKDSDLTDALSSFYSDIAAIETSNSPPVPPVNEEIKVEKIAEGGLESLKKKKKAKVKLSQGIAMKKKGVSKLVEKWKTVQMSYNE